MQFGSGLKHKAAKGLIGRDREIIHPHVTCSDYQHFFLFDRQGLTKISASATCQW